MKTRIPLNEAHAIAAEIITVLAPHCRRIEIAGSIRRQRPEVGDIEIVGIPEPRGVQFLLRTGQAEFSRKMVSRPTQRRRTAPKVLPCKHGYGVYEYCPHEGCIRYRR